MVAKGTTIDIPTIVELMKRLSNEGGFIVFASSKKRAKAIDRALDAIQGQLIQVSYVEPRKKGQ